MKVQYLFWHALTFVLDCIAFGFSFVTSRSPSNLQSRRELKAFINHCKRLPSRPIPFPKENEKIDVSIIIPVYNQWHLTRACLNSILETCQGSINYEIILADDCSVDDTLNANEEYPGIIVIKTKQNLGFLKNCNHAAEHARGTYILFLNNDTIVLPNWLSSLYFTMEEEDSAAIVGSKILHPSGRIQEAGAVVLNDGSVRRIGNRCHRQTPLFNIERETDYISGCSILVRKSFWDRVGGFDQRYYHGYFEDNDLAMSARAHHMKVIYQPNSELIHYQHRTYAFNKNKHRTLIRANKKIFIDKWQHVLEKHSKSIPWRIAMSRNEQLPSKGSSNRNTLKKLNILFYSQSPTYPMSHGNRSRMVKLIKKFEDMGHSVHVVLLKNFECNQMSLDGMHNQFNSLDIIPCKKIWFSLGNVPFDGWYVKGLGEHIRLLCKQYDIDTVVCSYIFQSRLLEFVPNHILKVIDTHDKMGNRSQMLRLNNLLPIQFSCTPEEEGAYLRRADLVLGITDEESHYFASVSGQNNILTISHVEKPKFINKDFFKLRHVGIVASRNQFNVSMIMSFLHIIHEKLSEEVEVPFVIHLVGDIKDALSWRLLNTRMKIFKKSWVKMHGFVPNIDEFYANMDLIVSPMTCGTGINIKTVEAMAYGMPLLTTIHGSRGLKLKDSMHNHHDLIELVDSLLAVSQNPHPELERLASLSRKQYTAFYEKNEENCKLIFEQPKLLSH